VPNLQSLKELEERREEEKKEIAAQYRKLKLPEEVDGSSSLRKSFQKGEEQLDSSRHLRESGSLILSGSGSLKNLNYQPRSSLEATHDLYQKPLV